MKLKKEQKRHGELIILLEKVEEVDLGSSSKPILTIFAHPRVQKHLVRTPAESLRVRPPSTPILYVWWCNNIR